MATAKKGEPSGIYQRLKDATGKWKYQSIREGRGLQTGDLKGTFFTRIVKPGAKWQSWVHLDGETFEAAKKALGTLETGFDATAKGFPVPEIDDLTQGNRIASKVAAYCDEIKANKARKTWQAYSNSLAYFEESCRKSKVQDVSRQDLLAFKTYLRKQGMSERSIYNNFLNTMVFLKWCGVKAGIKKDDWPKKPEREPEEYTDEEICKILNAANPDERLLLNSLLCSGLRSGEMAHLTYGDIDFKHSVWTVQPKEGWTTKTEDSQRDVPVPEWLTKKIRERMEADDRGKKDLIFFNSNGGPDLHMLRIVKRVAKRAKVSGRVDDHKFRSTAITRGLRAGNTVIDVMSWVGHAKPETILRYAAKVKVRHADTRKKAESAFTVFEAVGD
jgi:integrase